MARVNVQASAAPQQDLPFLNSPPLMSANVVFPLTQHLASGGKPVGKVSAEEGRGRWEGVTPGHEGKGPAAPVPNKLDTCFGKAEAKPPSLASSRFRSAFCSLQVCDLWPGGWEGVGASPRHCPLHQELMPPENLSTVLQGLS